MKQGIRDDLWKLHTSTICYKIYRDVTLKFFLAIQQYTLWVCSHKIRKQASIEKNVDRTDPSKILKQKTEILREVLKTLDKFGVQSERIRDDAYIESSGQGSNTKRNMNVVRWEYDSSSNIIPSLELLTSKHT